MTEEEIRFRADEARRIMDSSLMKEALASLESAALEEMLELPNDRDLDRARLCMRIAVIRDVGLVLRSYIMTGREALDRQRAQE